MKTRRAKGKYPSMTKEYLAWKSMFKRCYDKKYWLYHRYGGRGITVCSRWFTYENFASDMGLCPLDKTSLDRINNDGNYEPENCRWANDIEQSNNRSTNIRVTIGEVTKNLKEWCLEYNIEYKTVWQRISKGKDVIYSLTTPITSDGKFKKGHLPFKKNKK